MPEPAGWSWIGTRIKGNQVVIYDRGTTYGEYRYNPFNQSFVKMVGSAYDPVNSPTTWRFLIAMDVSIELPDNYGSVESFTEQRADKGYFQSLHLPWSVTMENYGLSGEGIGDGYNNSTKALDAVIEGDQIWSLLSYWREYHNQAWFIPSINELKEVYRCKEYLPSLTLNLTQIKNSEDYGLCRLWSSSESETDPANSVQIINWRDGSVADLSKDSTYAKFTICRYE